MTDRSDRLAYFMGGFAAATELLKRAFESGFLIKAVVLGAVVVDGCLRIGIILDHQIRTQQDEVLEDLLFQGDDDRIVTERQVYQRALEAAVISKDLFNELSALYSERNRVVHRYVVSDITTEHVFRVSLRYEQAIPRVNEAIRVLEDRQTRLGVGMVRREAGTDDPQAIRRMAEKKHAAEWLARALSKRAT